MMIISQGSYPMFKKFALLIMCALSLTGVLSVQAQTTLQDVPLQAAGLWQNNLYVYGPLDTLSLITNEPGNFKNPVWHGNTLAYLQLDENYLGDLWVSVDMQAPVLLAADLDTLYPISFTSDGLLLYAMVNPNNNTNSGNDYLFDLFTIAPVSGAVPILIGSFGNEEMAIGCGGGSSLPTDWQRWEEVGFGGQSVVLQMTAYGILHSMDCVGERTGLLDLATGRDVELGQSFAIAALSPDGSMLAGRIGNRAATESAQLATIDLSNFTVQTYETADIPDQVAWSADGASLFYSTQQMLDTLIPVTDSEREALRNSGVIEPVSPSTVGFPTFSVGIRRFDLASGDDSIIYQGSEDVFSIGRMFGLADKDVLVFTQIPNLQAWITAIAAGQFNSNGDVNSRQEQIATVPVSVFALNLGTQQLTTINVGVNLYTPNIAAISPSMGSN
jgi:hypothetical protein